MKTNFDDSFATHGIPTRSMLLALAMLAPVAVMGAETVSPDSRPTEGSGIPADANTVPAGKDSAPVKGSEAKAGKDARSVEDDSKKAGNDSREVTDSNPNKASPSAGRTKDGSVKADPRAAELRDGTEEKANPASRQIPERERLKDQQPNPGGNRAVTPAEVQFEKAATALANDTKERKLRLQGRDQALILMENILGKSSSVSIAEYELEKERKANEQTTENSGAKGPGERKLAADEMTRRLMGKGDKAAELAAEEGKTMTHSLAYASRTEVPAVLVASAELGAVQILSANGAEATLAGRGGEELRGSEARTVSYNVADGTALELQDVAFGPDTTRFADTRTEEVMDLLAVSLGNPTLAGARFVIEVHGEGELAQMRAEAIARKLVRNGISADRLIPVGFGENGEAAEGSSVVLFRLGKM